MYTIDKQFEFEYGHRVWTQTLDERFSLDNRCICRHLHGHHAIVKLHLAAKELTDGMVTDFKHLNCFKQFLDDVLDHRFIIDENDPLFLLDSAIINDFFGKKNFALNFSLINTNLMIASFSSIIAGNLYDSTKSYVSTIMMMVVLTVAGFLFSILIRRPERSRG